MFTSIILGAGKSTRMKANKSKLLFNIAGKPVINHIISSLKAAKAKSNLCVINNKSPELKKLLDEEKVDYTYQSVLEIRLPHPFLLARIPSRLPQKKALLRHLQFLI